MANGYKGKPGQLERLRGHNAVIGRSVKHWRSTAVSYQLSGIGMECSFERMAPVPQLWSDDRPKQHLSCAPNHSPYRTIYQVFLLHSLHCVRSISMRPAENSPTMSQNLDFHLFKGLQAHLFGPLFSSYPCYVMELPPR
jgi:hypothetical protein